MELTNKELNIAVQIKNILGKSNLPILNNYLIKDGLITMADLEQSVSIKVANSKSDTYTLVDGDVLKKFNKLKKDLVINETKITYDDKEYKTKIEDVSEFPIIPEVSGGIELNLNEFQRALKAVSFACSQQELRYVLNGVLVRKNHLVATDGRRLATVPFELSITETIIPLKAIKLYYSLQKLTGSATGVIKQEGHTIKIETDKYILMTRTVEGKYPNYKQVIPKLKDIKKVTLNLEDLMQGVKEATVLLPVAFSAIRFGEYLTYCKNGKDAIKTDVHIKNAESPVKYSLVYLLNALEGIKNYKGSKTVTIGLNKKDNSPCLIFSKALDYVNVLMPIRS